jgi:dTDP-4-amino-4,6-dideoxygalactose transaminase
MRLVVAPSPGEAVRAALARIVDWVARRRCASPERRATGPSTVVPPEESLRERVMTRTREGVQTTVYYPPCHLFSLYRNAGLIASLLRTEEFDGRKLTLPLRQQLEAV